MPEDLRRKHDDDVRLAAAEIFAKGRGCRSAATELGLPPTTVRQRHHTYVSLGIEGLLAMGKEHRSYRWDTKVAAAKAMVEGASRREG